MPNRSKWLVLVAACSLLAGLLSVPAVADALPGPAWDDLKAAANYGHIEYTLESSTRTYRFTVFNDTSQYHISAFAVYPETKLYGVVPVQTRPTPTGWQSVPWDGPLYSSGPTFGDCSAGFAADYYSSSIGPKSSKGDFSFRWIASELPTKLAFGVQLEDYTGKTLWAKVSSGDPVTPPSPVPDASTLALFASGAVLALFSQRGRRRMCAAI